MLQFKHTLLFSKGFQLAKGGCFCCRHRLTRALTAWHPSDASARVLLGPWQSVFDPSDWEALLQRSILPKLAQSLQTVICLTCPLPAA